MVKLFPVERNRCARARAGISRHFFVQSAFTLVEILISMAVIGTTASSLLWGLTMMNKSAVLGRLYTGATAVAQQQIDLVLTDGPFVPASNQFLTELPDASTTNRTATAQVPIYQESSTSSAVMGTMTTVIEDTSATYNTYNASDLNIYRITVTITFTYRGEPKSVTLATMRSPDS